MSNAALVGVVVSGAVLGGLIWWGSSRAKAQRDALAKDDPTVTPIGHFPALKVGDVVLIDAAMANLPPPFAGLGRVPAQVDMILQDPAVVSVKVPPGGVRGVPGVPFFSGTISRLAVLSVLPPVSLEV